MAGEIVSFFGWLVRAQSKAALTDFSRETTTPLENSTAAQARASFEGISKGTQMRIPTTMSLASRRRGTTIVEAAMVLPVFFMFLFTIIEFGHSQLVINMLDAACRRAARYGSTNGVTTAEVLTQVENLVGTVAAPNDVTIIVKDASVYDTGGTLPSSSEDFHALPDVEVADLEPRDLFLVRVEVQYSEVALVSLPFLQSLENAVISGEAFTRHE